MQAILAVGCYLYLENFVPGFTTEVTIPIVKVNIDFGWFYAVLVFIMFTGESNGVNLSDGLDGLATGLSMVAIAPFIIYAIMIKDLSVIIQVVSFKTRGKRVFKMAPIHHHFEMLGWSEQQVTISFWFIGFICGIIAIVIGVM